MVNALRISLDILLRPVTLLPHEDLHRTLGTVVCFSALCLLYNLCDRVLSKGRGSCV